MATISRREALALMSSVAIGSRALRAPAAGIDSNRTRGAYRFRVRALTAGVAIEGAHELGIVESALDFLDEARRQIQEAGYEVQTIRIATNPFLLDALPREREAALSQLAVLDRLIAERGALLSIGPVFAAGQVDDTLAEWSRRLIIDTRTVNFSVAVAAPDRGIQSQAVVMAARVTSSLATAVPGGVGNFRYAAAANVPAGTPFFPVAHHVGEPSLAVGLESANLVADAFTDAVDASQATSRLRDLLNAELTPIETLARAAARQANRRYLGIDASPAPGADASIGRAIEQLTQQPFGSASTLRACAAVTEAIRSLKIETCGYTGLMLPVLEDPVLAMRAAEGRIRLPELLLYSSVCGTGLDVVPVPGDATPEILARVIGDVAILATRLNKPPSARLLPVPGKVAGDVVEFDDPRLHASAVLPLEP